jgi:hypothetical protein
MSIGDPWRDDDGNWMVPTRAETDDGGAVGVGWEKLTPDHAMYREWVEHIQLRMAGSPAWAAQVADTLPG